MWNSTIITFVWKKHLNASLSVGLRVVQQPGTWAHMTQRGVDVCCIGGAQTVSDVLVLGIPVPMNLLVLGGGSGGGIVSCSMTSSSEARKVGVKMCGWVIMVARI